MKMNPALIGLITAMAVTAFVGCAPSNGRAKTQAEGIIYYVEFQMVDGKTGGFTRVNNSHAVPGGNGSWNIDAYGRLTSDFLIITRPQRKELGPRVIPVQRLVDLQFGDGGIRQVDESHPNPPQ